MQKLTIDIRSSDAMRRAPLEPVDIADNVDVVLVAGPWTPRKSKVPASHVGTSPKVG